MRKHSTLWQSMLIPMICLLMCVAINIASATTVLLEMKDINNTPLTSGSGFFVSDTLIVTNADAIKDAVTGTAQVVGKNKKHTIKAVAAVDPKTGLVLLSALPSDVTPLSLGDSDTIDIAIPSPKKIKYHYKILGFTFRQACPRRVNCARTNAFLLMIDDHSEMV